MARPKSAVIDESVVTIPTTKPAEGGRRIVLAIVDDQGTVKATDWEMTAPLFRHLAERYSWEQHFYSAILKLTR